LHSGVVLVPVLLETIIGTVSSNAKGSLGNVQNLDKGDATEFTSEGRKVKFTLEQAIKALRFQRCTSSLSLTSELYGSGWLTP
jgi:hypothetical protein